MAVGYVDPGNWATSIAAGSRFGYILLSVVLLSSILAMMFQEISARLGIATNMDLAQATRATVSKPVAFFLWILTELAIMATDIAEVIGSALALNLLFHIPLIVGVVITTADVFLLLLLQKKGFRWIESIVAVLMFSIFGIFFYEMVMASPNWGPLLEGYLPSTQIISNSWHAVPVFGNSGCNSYAAQSVFAFLRSSKAGIMNEQKKGGEKQ